MKLLFENGVFRGLEMSAKHLEVERGVAGASVTGGVKATVASSWSGSGEGKL